MANSIETLGKIKELLDELEESLNPADQEIFAHNFDALELPSIVASIVDFLQPNLHPYEAAIYWSLFRKSIVATGQQFVRASTKGMQNNVIQSSSGQSAKLSYAAVQKALSGLEQKKNNFKSR